MPKQRRPLLVTPSPLHRELGDHGRRILNLERAPVTVQSKTTLIQVAQPKNNPAFIPVSSTPGGGRLQSAVYVFGTAFTPNPFAPPWDFYLYEVEAIDDSLDLIKTFGANEPFYDVKTAAPLLLFTDGDVSAIYLSEDRGGSFTSITMVSSGIKDLAVGTGGALYAVFDDQIYKSSDKGATWQALAFDGGTIDGDADISARRGGVAMLWADDPGATDNLYVSVSVDDATWVHTLLQSNATQNTTNGILLLSTTIVALWALTSDSDVTGTVKTAYSEDGGVTWSTPEVITTWADGNLYAPMLVGQGAKLYIVGHYDTAGDGANNPGQHWKSVDSGMTWEMFTDPYVGINTTVMGADGVAITTDGDLYVMFKAEDEDPVRFHLWKYDGEDWTEIALPAGKEEILAHIAGLNWDAP